MQKKHMHGRRFVEQQFTVFKINVRVSNPNKSANANDKFILMFGFCEIIYTLFVDGKYLNSISDTIFAYIPPCSPVRISDKIASKILFAFL